MQLALLRVVRHIRRFESEDTFWSWLTVLARSAVVDEERKRHRYLAFLDRLFRREQIEAATNVEADTRLRELLTAVLDTLPWDERELIRRKYFARESVKEIAADMGATEKAIESQLVRVRRKLKQFVADLRAALATRAQELKTHDPRRELAVCRTRIAELERRIVTQPPSLLRTARQRFERVEGILRVVGPEATLRRGYSITSDDAGEVIR